MVAEILKSGFVYCSSAMLRPVILVLALALGTDAIDAAGADTALPIACVTGASGYAASEIVFQLLERGTHHVRGTVRSLQNKEKLVGLRAMEGADARLELLEADLLNPASFDACVHGAEVVFHTASPFITSGITDPMAQLVEPAVEGTLAVLKAAASAGTVERVVLTSSVAAVMGGVGDKDGCFNEDDWNESSNLEGDGLSQYRYSKLMAERAAWEFVNSEAGGGTGLQLSTVLPSFIVGPPRTGRIDSESLASMAAVLRGEAPLRGPTPMIDVRDVARVHLEAAFNLPNPTPWPRHPSSAAAADSDANSDPNSIYDTSRRFLVSSPSVVTPDELLVAVAKALPHVDVFPPKQPPRDDDDGEHGGGKAVTSAPPSNTIFCSKTLPGLLALGSGAQGLIDPKKSLEDMATAMLDLAAVAPKLIAQDEL